jgi:hypothetical protein
VITEPSKTEVSLLERIHSMAVNSLDVDCLRDRLKLLSVLVVDATPTARRGRQLQCPDGSSAADKFYSLAF